jgi:hypothetical protein
VKLRWKFWAIGLILVLILGVAATWAITFISSTTQGVEGVCLVCVVPGPPPPAGEKFEPRSLPREGVVIQAHSRSGQIVAETTTDTNGKFHLRLLPGMYRLVCELTPHPLDNRLRERSVVVFPGFFTEVNFDIKIIMP